MVEAGGKISICLLFAVFCFTSCKQEIQPQEIQSEVPVDQFELVSDTVVYNLINSTLLEENEVYKECPNLFDRKPDIILNEDFKWLEKLDSIFSETDIQFIKSQYLNERNLIWDKSKLNNKNLIDFSKTILAEESDNHWENLEKFYEEEGCFSILRIPVFNLNKDIAIIEVQYNCALDWGKSEAYIYKRNESGKWFRFVTLWKLVS